MVDSFIGNHCLALVFEATMGEARLLVTSLDLSGDLATRHAARQLRESLLDYVASDAFQPSVAIIPTRVEIMARFDRAVAR